VTVLPFQPLTARQSRAVSHAFDDYGRYLGLPVVMA